MKCLGDKIDVSCEIASILNSYILLNNITLYVEPFVGGANIIDKIQCKYKVGTDNNKYIIALYNYIKQDGKLPDTVSREQYLDCKAHYLANDNKYDDWYIGLVGFNACIGGKFFETGYNSNCSNELGKLKEQSRNIKDADFSVHDYCELNTKDSLIYLDPPVNTSKKCIGTVQGFDFDKMWNKARGWTKDNIVVISAFEAPDDFNEVWEQESNNKYVDRLYVHKSIDVVTENFDF